MDELLKKLQDLHGLSAEQAGGILQTITGHIKEKFPMVAGAIDNFFKPSAGGATADSGSFLDKISDIIPGAAGEKIEAFAKDNLSGLTGK